MQCNFVCDLTVISCRTDDEYKLVVHTSANAKVSCCRNVSVMMIPMADCNTELHKGVMILSYFKFKIIKGLILLDT